MIGVDDTGGGLEDAVDGFEEGGFAGAVGAEDGDELAGLDVEGDVGEDGTTGIGKVNVLDLKFHLRVAPLASKKRKRGAPKNEVMAPTGRTTGEMMVRAKVSEMRRRAAPVTAEAGMRKRWSVPMMRRIIWGAMRPMKPMMPMKETETAVMREAKNMLRKRTLST